MIKFKNKNNVILEITQNKTKFDELFERKQIFEICVNEAMIGWLKLPSILLIQASSKY